MLLRMLALLLALSSFGCVGVGALAPMRSPKLLLESLPRNLTQQRFWAADVLEEWRRHISDINELEFREFSSALMSLRADMFEYFNSFFGAKDFNAACHFSLLPNLIYGDNYPAVQALARIWFEFVAQSLRGHSTHHFLFKYLQQYLRVGKSEVTYSNLLRHSGQLGQSTLTEFARRRLPDVPVPADCRRTLLVQLTNPQQLLDSQQPTITAELQARLISMIAPGNACLRYNSTHKIIHFVDIVLYGHFEALRVPNRMWIDPRLSATLPGQLSSVANLIRYGYPALLVVCTISNLVALVFSAVVLSESSVCLYFLALSVLDLLCLWSNLLPTILSLRLDILLRQSSTAGCRLVTFFEIFFTAAAAWTVAALAMAKVLSMLMPFNRNLNSRRTHRLVIGLVLAMTALLCSPLLINRRRVAIVEADFFAQCWRWDLLFLTYRAEKLWLAFLFPVLPLTVILACNCALLALRRRHLRQAASTGSGAGTERPQLFGSLTFVSSVFLVFTAPNTVVQLIEAARSDDINQYNVIDELSNGNGTLLNYWAFVTHFVMLLHNAFNIFTYGMSAPYLRLAFRQRLSRGLRCPGFLQGKPLYGSVLSMRTSASQRTDRTEATECGGPTAADPPASATADAANHLASPAVGRPQ